MKKICLPSNALSPIALFIILFIATLFQSPQAWSQSSSLDAHVHGEAELMIAVEGNRVEMQLVSPAANIFGFEHEPANAEQIQQIHRAEEILSATDSLFIFESLSCQAIEQHLDIPFLDSLSEAEHQHAEEDHHEHADDHHHDEHAEVVAHYVYECDGDAPSALNTSLLSDFPAIEAFEVQWVTETTQGAQELSANQSRIDLR